LMKSWKWEKADESRSKHNLASAFADTGSLSG